jgi:hypothetical protein
LSSNSFPKFELGFLVSSDKDREGYFGIYTMAEKKTPQRVFLESMQQFSALKRSLMDYWAVGVSFQKAAKPSLTPWNGSVVLIFFSAQPRRLSPVQRRSSLPAPGPLTQSWGRSTNFEEFVLRPSEKRHPRSFLDPFQSTKLLRIIQCEMTHADFAEAHFYRGFLELGNP